MRRVETKALNLQASELIQLGMVVEAGTGHDETNPKGTQVHKNEERS